MHTTFWTTIALDFVRIYFDEERGMNEQSVGGVEWNFGDVRLKKQQNCWLSEWNRSERCVCGGWARVVRKKCGLVASWRTTR
jgi:hypothetical protein